MAKRGLRPLPTVTILPFALVILLAVAATALAGETETEFVPELDVYVKTSDRTRLYFLGQLAQNLTKSDTDGTVGVHLDVTLSPILRRRLRDADWVRDRYFWIRLGYRLIGDLDGGKNASKENRGIVEATGRFPFPHDIWLVNRFRTDLRGQESGFSARLRDRLRIEGEVDVVGVTMVPYAQAEVFYNTQFDAWNRQLYQGGAEVILTQHWAVEPYYARQEDQRSSPAHLNEIGLKLNTYW